MMYKLKSSKLGQSMILLNQILTSVDTYHQLKLQYHMLEELETQCHSKTKETHGEGLHTEERVLL